jgi:hypothetical protein
MLPAMPSVLLGWFFKVGSKCVVPTPENLDVLSWYPWRLDDEQLMYPFYEKAVKAGINISQRRPTCAP